MTDDLHHTAVIFVVKAKSLVTGDTIEKGDVRFTSSVTWQYVEDALVGLKLQPSHANQFRRPIQKDDKKT